MAENDKNEEKINEEIFRENKEYKREKSERTTPKMERPKPWPEPPVEKSNTQEDKI